MLYPRTIEIRRARTVAAQPDSDTIGLTGYSGSEVGLSPANPQGEILIAKGVAASIQAGTAGGKAMRSLPQDVTASPQWNIYIPLAALPKGIVRDRDYIVDDEQYRYQVASSYWNILGWRLICVRLLT